MTTTPEQLAKWREEFESVDYKIPTDIDKSSGKYLWNGLEMRWQGYLRRCQETEQAIKDERKKALEEAYAIYEQAQELSHVKDGLRELLK